jgi:hypothetical protein
MPISRDEWFGRLAKAAEEAKQKQLDMQRTLNGNPTGDQAFDAIIGFGGALSAMAIEAGKMKAELRKERRAERYAIRKRLGLIKTSAQRKAEKAAKRVAEIEEEKYRDSWTPESCYCSSCRMPPCSWCTDPANDPDAQDDHAPT